jgi:hypothetical protein
MRKSRGSDASYKVTATLMIVFFSILAAGVISFKWTAEYTGEPKQVCIRQNDGVRRCSDPGRSDAEFQVLIGNTHEDITVHSEPLLIASRVLLASLVPYVGVAVPVYWVYSRRNKAAKSGLSD